MATIIHSSVPIILLPFMVLFSLFNFSVALTIEDLALTDNTRALDPNDPVAIAVAKFAVEEHNKIAKDIVQFEIVAQAAEQETPGIRTEYYVRFDGKEAGVVYPYGAVVLDNKNSGKELHAFAKLVSF